MSTLPTADELRAHAEALEAEWLPKAAEAQRTLDQATEKIEEARRHRQAARVLDGYAAEEEPLTTRHGYATVGGMSSTQTVAKHPGPVANKGPASSLAAELGLSSLEALAEALKEKPATVRSWNLRKSVPARIEPIANRLRAKLAKK